MTSIKNASLLTLTILTFSACITQPTQSVNTEQTTSNASSRTEELKQADTTTSSPQYIAYTETTYNDSLGKKPFALFFHADWCHVCLSLEKDIMANLSDFPEGSTILQANFDTEKELKTKYAITTQSIVVIIDAEGNEVVKLVAPSADEVRKALSTVLS